MKQWLNWLLGRQRPTRDEIEEMTLDRLRRFTEALENGAPLRGGIVTVEDTPDGPMTTITRGTWAAGEFTADVMQERE